MKITGIINFIVGVVELVFGLVFLIVASTRSELTSYQFVTLIICVALFMIHMLVGVILFSQFNKRAKAGCKRGKDKFDPDTYDLANYYK